MNEILLKIVVITHILFVLFVFLVPFFGTNMLLLMHFIVVPFVILHWITNQNQCSLTIIERKIRKEIYGEEPNPNDCIAYNIITPIYDFNKNYSNMSFAIYLITIFLWLCTAYKINKNYNKGEYDELIEVINSLLN
jgi:hypothetical protein